MFLQELLICRIATYSLTALKGQEEPMHPCDEDMPTDGGTVLVPLYRGDVPMTRKMFAFWPESSDSSLQWEFADVLRQNIK